MRFWAGTVLALTCWSLLACGLPEANQNSDREASVRGTSNQSRTSTSSTFDESVPIDLVALRRASLVVVTLDTTRADYLEPYGSDVSTPHLQDIAQQGVVFERAWATAPVTLPTHVSLFSGLDPPSHGVRNNGIHYVSEQTPLLAELLQNRGFRTAAFVSAAVLERRYGLGRGFEHYDDDLTGGPKQLRLNAERPAAATVTAAQGWLDTVEDGERFFLWVHLFDPHAPYTPPSPWAKPFRERPYAGEIAAVDAALGDLMQHPRLADRAQYLLMVVGDHGESLGAHGESTHAMLAYDSTLRIPWLMRLPEGGDGFRLTPSVSQIDFMPTVVDLLFEAPPKVGDTDGLSLRSLLVEGFDERLSQRSLYAETLVPLYTYGWSPLRSMRRGDFKWIEAPTPELYDLSNDPDEQRNLLQSATPEALKQVAELEATLEARGFSTSETETAEAVDPETAAKLRSLGYLGTRIAPQRTERPDPKEVIALHQDLEEAQHLFLRHDIEPAIDRLRRALRQDGDNLVALSTLAKALVAVGDVDGARPLAQRAIELDPEHPELLVTQGRVELGAENLEAAHRAFEAALVVDPRWLDAALEKARVLFRMERQEEGRATLQAILRDDPQHSRALVAWAEWVHLPRGELEEARRSLQDLVKRQPYLAEGWKILGRALELSEAPEEALEVYRLGLEQLPKDGPLWARLGVLLARMGRWQEAEEPLRLALDRKQHDATVYLALGRIAQRRASWKDAETAARQALEEAPDMSSAWNLLAASLEEQQRFDEALETYGQAIDADRTNWQALFNRSTLWTKLGRYSEARQGFEAVLRQQPGHARTHLQLGALMAGALGDTAAARRHFEAGLAVDPDPQTAKQLRDLLARLPR